MNTNIDLTIQNAKEGDLKAFEQLYINYKDKIYALALATLKNTAEAEDVTRQTFIHAYTQLYTLSDPNAFDMWIRYIALNECEAVSPVDENETGHQNTERLEDDFFVPQDYIERYDLSNRLKMIIDDLPRIKRQVLLLSVYNKLTFDQIAQIMNIAESDVIFRIRSAKGQVKTELEAFEQENDERFDDAALIPFENAYSFLIYASMMPSSTATKIWKDIRGAVRAIDAQNAKQRKISVGVKAVIIASIAVIVICVGIIAVLLMGPTFSAKKSAETQADETTAVTETATSPTATDTPATEAKSDPEPAPAVTPDPEPETETAPEEQANSTSDIDSGWLSKITGTYFVPKMAGYVNTSLEIAGDGTVTERTSGRGAHPIDESTSAEITSLSGVSSTSCQFETTPDFSFYSTNGSYTDSFKATCYSPDTPMSEVPSSVKEYLAGFSYYDLSGDTLGVSVIETDKNMFYVRSSGQ